MKAFCCLVSVVALSTSIQGNLAAQEKNGPFGDLVPQYLLGLVHAPEVHKEMKLSV